MQTNEKIEILILGDICPTKDYRKLFDTKNPFEVFGELTNELKNADLTIANLEAPATNNTKAIMKTGPNLKAEPYDIHLLKKAGIDVLSLANNHILDFGSKGLEDTLKTCDFVDISTVGVGKNIKEAKKPLFVSIKGKKIGIISFAESEFNLATKNSSGANKFDVFESFHEIQQAKLNSDFLIVLYHGGIEHYSYPSPLLQKKCRGMVEFGADLILCQHSHCIGTIEQINDATIIYGQGNSVFGYRPGDSAWNEGLVVKVKIPLEGSTEIELDLINATKDGIELANNQQKAERLEGIKKMSFILKDTEKVEELWDDFCLSKSSMYLPLLYGWNRIFNKLNRLTNNFFINLLYSKKNFMISMNLIRCESHKEVVDTILSKK